MKTTMRSRRRSKVACLLALATAAAVLPSAPAADLYYMGAQYTPGAGYPAPWPAEGSWFDTNLWQNNTLPTSTTNAIFGYDQVMPNDNLLHAPHTLHFGNFGYYGTTTIPGGTASVGTVTLLKDDWTFDFASGQDTGFTGVLTPSTGSLTVGTLALAPAAGQSATLAIKNGTLTVSNRFNIATQAGAASVTLASGSLAAGVTSIGTAGAGLFTQTGGTFSTSMLYLGEKSGSTGTFALGGGVMSANWELVGYGSTGSLTQTGGTHTAGYELSITATGYYSVMGGTLTTNHIFANSGSLFLGGTSTVYLKQGLVNRGQLSVDGSATIYATGMVDFGNATLLDTSHISLVLAANSLLVLPAGVSSSVFGSFVNNGGLVVSAGSTITIPAGTQIATGVGGCSTLMVCAGTLTGEGRLWGGIQVQGDTASVTQTYLYVDDSVSGMSSGYLSIAEENLGYSGVGTFTQVSGTHTIGSLYMGRNGGTAGVFTLSGGSLYTSIGYIGSSGSGNFLQNGGLHNITVLYLGYNAGATGSYALSDGLLKGYSNSIEYVGYAGNGIFVQTAGTHSISGTLHLGYNSGSKGVFSLSGGVLTVGSEQWGYKYGDNSGTFVQSGGTHTVGELFMAWQSGTQGSYTLSNGQLNGGGEGIGGYGVATFCQTGGTHTVGNLAIGQSAPGSASYSMSGGLLTVATERIGYEALGIFTQTSGTHSVTGTLSLGYNSSGIGAYILENAVLTSSAEIIGVSGSGQFAQSGGSHAVSGALVVGSAAGSFGTYTLSSGGLTSGTVCLGDLGKGTLLQTGGTHTITGAIVLGQSAGSGSYALSAGQLTAASEIVGGNGGGTFTQTGGIHNAGTLSIGSLGLFSLSGGLLQAPGGLANEGSLVFAGSVTLETGGIANLAGVARADLAHLSLVLSANSLLILPAGTNPTDFGAFTNNGGLVATAGAPINLPAGYQVSGGGNCQEILVCNGTLAGSASLHGGIKVQGALAAASLDTLRVENLDSGINAGQLSVVREFVGYSGTGTFSQSGGTHTLSGSLSRLYVGYQAGSTGCFALHAGQFASINEEIGSSGTGLLTQDGGTHTVSGTLFLGQNAGSSGTYALSGGTHTVSGTLFLGQNSGSSGTYALSGGVFSSPMTRVGVNGSGSFIQTGGQTTVGTLNVGTMGLLSLTGGTFEGVLLSTGSLVLGGATTLTTGSQLDLSSATLLDVSHFVINVNTPNNMIFLPAGNFGSIINPDGWTFQEAKTTVVPVGKSVDAGPRNLKANIDCSGTFTVGTLTGGIKVQGSLSRATLTSLVGDTTLLGVTAGQLTITAGYVGYNSAGTFTQTGGTSTVSGSLTLGQNVAGQGCYVLSNGYLLVSNNEYIGYSGMGTLTQSDGTHTISGNMGAHCYLGYNAGATGSYSLSKGQFSTSSEYVGYSGTGNFVQTGGTHSVSMALYVGYAAGSQGTLLVQSGTLSPGFVRIGAIGSATGTILQTGGLVRTTGTSDWQIGGLNSNSNAAAVGVYNLSGGTLTLGCNLMVGTYGTGTFNQSGGTATLSLTTSVGRYAGSTGHLLVSGGTLVQTAGSLTIGDQGDGDLTVSGSGLVQLTGNLRLDASATGSGTVILNGGTLITPRVEVVTATNAKAYVYFNGGTLKATTSTTTYMQGLTSAKIQAAGAKFDTNSYKITIAQNLLEDPSSPGGGLTKLGGGTLTLAGANTFTGGITISGGTLVASKAALGSGPLTVNSPLTMIYTTVPAGDPNAVLDYPATSITIGTTGLIVLAYYDLLLRYAPGSGPTALSTTLNWINTGKLTLYPRDASQVLLCIDNGALATPFTRFDGIPLTDANQIFLKYTWKGDATLDNLINYNDYLAIDAGYLFGGSDWTQGDFNGDHMVTAADYALIDASALAQNQAFAAPLIDLHTQQFGEVYTNALAAAIPEPATLSLLAGGALILLRRRR